MSDANNIHRHFTTYFLEDVLARPQRQYLAGYLDILLTIRDAPARVADDDLPERERRYGYVATVWHRVVVVIASNQIHNAFPDNEHEPR